MARPPVPQRRPSHLQGLMVVLHLAERQGQRCGGPILLAGLVLGAGGVELSSGPLGQTSRFSLELLMLLVLQLVGPMLVTLLAMALLLPRWLEHAERRAERAWREALPAAALVGGVLASPRADLALMIYRDECYNPETPHRGITEAILTKHRNGPVGTCKLLFEPQFTRLRNLAA